MRLYASAFFLFVNAKVQHGFDVWDMLCLRGGTLASLEEKVLTGAISCQTKHSWTQMPDSMFLLCPFAEYVSY